MKSVFILWTNPKLEFINRKFFLHLTIDNFLMCVYSIYKYLFFFERLSQSILLQVLHPLEDIPLSTFKQKIFRTNKFKIKALQNPFLLVNKQSIKFIILSDVEKKSKRIHQNCYKSA